MIIKITKKSLAQFQFGDTEPVITVDVIEVADMWHEINFSLRVLENDMWTIPANKVNEFAVNRLNFVQGIVAAAYGDHPVPTLTRMEAEEFIRQIQKETENLRNFTSPKDAETSSVPENTEQVNFSQ